MAQTTDKNNSNNESGDNIADNSNRDPVQSVGASTSIAPDSGEGVITGDTTISSEVNKDSSHVESILAKPETDTDNLSETECTKVSDGLDDSEDIELQWDEDDDNDTTVDNDTHKIDDDLEEKLLEETEQNNQDSSNVLEKDTDLVLEIKLLQEPTNSQENCERKEQETIEVPMELNEDELLQEVQSKDTEVVNINDKDPKKQEESLEENTVGISEIHSSISEVIQEENAVAAMMSNDDSQHDNLPMDVDVSQGDSTLQVRIGCGLSQPDVMIEIPTQETIDINDLPDSPIDGGIDDSMETFNISVEKVAAPSVEDPQPSTSTVIPKMTPDSSNEAQEVTDCLGLLAESSRVMDEYEDQDDEDGDADDDDDFDQDESSNQMTAEHSEDSNAQHSENERARGGLEREEENFGFDEIDIDIEDDVNEVLRRDFKQEIEGNDDEYRTLLLSNPKRAKKTSEIKKAKKGNDIATCGTNEKDVTSEPQDNIKEEKEDNVNTTRKEKDSTSVSQDNLEKAVENNVISTCVTEEKESISEFQDKVMKEIEDSIISTCVTKEEDGTILQNNVTEENEDNITSTCVTKEKVSITVSQDDINKENEEAKLEGIPSIESTEKLQEDTNQSEDDTVELENAVHSVDPLNMEQEDGIPFGIKIKIENEDTTKPRKPLVPTPIVTRYIETQINDDVIEQVIDIETVKISDDEDDEPPKETQENLQQKTDMTTPLEKPLQGTTRLEKNILVEEVTALEKTTEVEKSTEITAVRDSTASPDSTAASDTTAAPDTTPASDTSAAPEKPLEMEKTTEPDEVTINLTPDQTDTEESHTADGSTTSPNSSRKKNLTVAKLLNTNIISVVELEESSSEDDIQEVYKETPPEHSISQLQKLLDASFKPPPLTSITSVNIPTGIDIMSTSGAGGNKTQIVTNEREVVISGVPKPPQHKTARLNTSEVTIKTTSNSEPTLVIPEAKAQEQSTAPAPTRPKLSLEIFSLDSDEEETSAKEPGKPKNKTKKCINSACSSGSTALEAADIATAVYYDAARKKKPLVCQPCADAVLVRKQKLMEGIKNFTPLLKLDSSSSSQDLVEISDSESEGEDSEPQEQQPTDTIGEEAAKFLEENLADVLNETWKKYKLDDRLKERQVEINAEILKLDQESKEINQMLEDCQRVTDKLRSDLYATFEHRKVEVPPLLIYETPEFTIEKSMMDQNIMTLDDELKRKRELANACLKRHRKKKREQAQLQKLLSQNEPKYDNEQIQKNMLERRRELSRKCSQRYRDNKRLSRIKKIEHEIDDTQIPGPSHGESELSIKDRKITIHIPGTSANMNVPIVMKDFSVNLNDPKNNCAGLRTNNVIQVNERSCVFLQDEENYEINIDDNSPPLQVQTHASVTPTSQFNRSSTYSSYARHSSAHTEFHRQFTQNSFGHACKICDRLWFKNDLKNLNNESVKFVMTFLPNVVENSIAVCLTCRTSIQKKSIPSMAVYNGFEYPIIPSNLLNFPLDLVSERLISPRIPFMQIRRLRSIHGQYGIYGQIINVPIEINTMVNSLPRNISDDHCIYIHIKRKKIHKSSFLHGFINKQTIKEWLRYLVNTPLYRTYDIKIDEQFFDNLHDDRVDSDKHDENDRNEFTENIPIEDSLLAQQQTVMWNDDLYLNIAPGENNVPISLLFDEHAEELSFPSIYLGQFRQFREGITVTPFMMANSELRRSDRRGVTPHHLLYMAMKIIRLRVKDSLRVAFKHIGKNSNVTKEQIQTEDYIHSCIESNLAFLPSIPNSTWYWSEKKKDLFAMIKQLGRPTVFFTISANEIGWPDLLQLLYKLNKRDSITKEAVAKLHFMVKSTLINEDAVTCAIYFNKLVNVIMTILQSKKCSPFRKFRVLHYFKRIEFQHRGSPQAHILAWLDNAPNDALNEDYNKAIELIDALISVSASEASGNIKLQTHKHTFTCFKKITSNKAQKCRFEAPFMPCKKTMILCPMKDTEEGFIKYRKRYAQIRVSLENEDFVDIGDFYSRNGINSDDEYYNIIRAGITRPKVFVKRDPSEKWHHPFNPFILNIVKSNTDFQFITEEYSCAAYVVEYINKTNRGVSHLRRKIIETMNEHPEFDIIEITKKISVNIINHTEITSQEAAWYLLREPMCKSSLSIVYIPTVWPTERQRIRKNIEESSKLEDDCTDIWKENWFDRYEKRPEYLESVTLAQFVSKYTKSKNGEFIERNEPRIIRYRNYDMSSDFQEYKREMVTLHLPFRNEEVEILAEMKFISIYDDNENIILQRRKEFESNINIDKTNQICIELSREETSLDEDEIQDNADRYPEPNPFEQLYNDSKAEINSDLRLASLHKLDAVAEKKEDIMSTADFCTPMGMANEKQKALQLHYMGPDTENAIPATVINQSRLSAKRKLLTNSEVPAKRPAIPLGYTPLENSKQKVQENKADDDKDISVVKLSAEAAPADLPPPGELSRPPLRVGMAVYAMRNAFGPWFKGKVIEITPKNGTAIPFTMCRIKFDHKLKNSGKILPARCIAYAEPTEVRMTIGTRLIALFKDVNKRESYYSGVVAEIPNPVNNYRYLVFFDDGYAQYVSHAHTRLVCECSNLVWEEVHPLSREFVREYLMAYPERPMVRLHEGQHLKTEWDGKWWSSRVVRVDASLAQVVFLGDGRREWVYRGSTRLAPLYLELRAAERHRPRPVPRSSQPRSNLLPYVEYTRSVEQPTNKTQEIPVPVALTTQQQTEQEIRRQRAVAKKSTTTAALSAHIGPTSVGPPLSGPGVITAPLDSDNSRVVYYTPKNAVRPYKLVPHTCSPACKRSDVLSLKELRTYNPLAKPLLSGWERQIVRYKGQREVLYRAPCGRRLRSMRELHRYLRLTDSELPVDLFDFFHATHCLAEFVLHKCLVGKKDLSHGKENVPVPCVNCYDESLPEFCSYNTERTPTSGVPLNLDPDFLCGCDCTDDCEDKSKCACWKMTLEGARTIGLDGTNVGYVYKRLPEPLPSGIYECNSRCKCKQTCLNRVAQHPLQLKLQVFKTLNRGWGIRALNDVPKGAFLCVYAGNLLTDATANLDGLNEGDEYLAELDYIEVVEQMKEGYEEDIPDADKKLDKKESIQQEESEEEQPSSSEDDENASKTDKEDDDFKPGYVALGVSDFSKSLRKRSKNKTGRETKEEDEKEKESKGGDPEEDCITISDDEEVREPSRFTANPGMAGNDFVSKYRSVRTLFGEDEACYIMDAKVQGNIGRYLNHSCSPNVFVQNVFVDTHDPRFPWVAFFALSHVRAGTELTWNYNYDVGSVPGKILYCYCEAPNCRGRLL